jgi:hypothetical protein
MTEEKSEAHLVTVANGVHGAAVLGTAAAPAFSTSRQSKAPFRVIKNVRLAKSLRVAGADRG